VALDSHTFAFKGLTAQLLQALEVGIDRRRSSCIAFSKMKIRGFYASSFAARRPAANCDDENSCAKDRPIINVSTPNTA